MNSVITRRGRRRIGKPTATVGRRHRQPSTGPWFFILTAKTTDDPRRIGLPIPARPGSPGSVSLAKAAELSGRTREGLAQLHRLVFWAKDTGIGPEWLAKLMGLG